MAPVQGVDSEAKLAFVEFLLTSIDVQESARRAVDWLVAHATVNEAAVLVPEAASNDMLLVAEHGVSSGAIMDFALSRDDASHPLIEALKSPIPLFVDSLPARHRVPLEAKAFHVIPLRSEASEPGHGLLLVSGVGPGPRRRDAVAGADARQAGLAPARAASCSPRPASGRSGCCSTASSTPSPTRSC